MCDPGNVSLSSSSRRAPYSLNLDGLAPKSRALHGARTVGRRRQERAEARGWRRALKVHGFMRHG